MTLATEQALLAPAGIRRMLRQVPDWRKRGKAIVRTFAFENFPAAVRFVTRVAKVAEKAWHHPDIDIRWNTVTLRFSTHSAGGLTGKDFETAARIDRLPGVAR